MAGPRKSTPLPAKKPKAKATKPLTVPKPSLSSEFVVDSDDSGDSKTTRGTKSASETASSRSISATLAISKSSTSQAKSSKKRKLPSSSPAQDDSGGSESGNGSISEDEMRPSKKRVLAVHNESPNDKPEPATARPVPGRSSIKPSADIKPLNQSKDWIRSDTSQESNSEAGESSEDSGSRSESDSGKESNSASSDKTSLQSPGKESPIHNSVPQQPETTYEPPADFEPTSISSHPASKLSEILAPSNLHGKQIWHITVPESVPISLVKEVSPQKIGNGASVLEHQGAKYGLLPQSDIEQSSSRALLLPSTQTNSYQLSKAKIVKTLHLQQLVSFPNHAPRLAVHPNGSLSSSDSYRKTPRQQPEGLRMRYRPFGASDSSDLDSNPEPMPKAREFRVPAPVKESSPEKKRKRRESDDNNSKNASAVKPKKRKQNHQATAGAVEDPIDIDTISNIKAKGSESPTKILHPEIIGVSSKSILPDGTETKEERKRRRKEQKTLEKRGSPSKAVTALPLDVKQTAETIQPGEVVEGAPTLAIANAVEGTKSINTIPSTTTTTTSKDWKAKRKDKTLKRTEVESKDASSRVSPSNGEDVSRRDEDDGRSRDRDRDQMMTEIENAQREAEIPVSLQAPAESDHSKRSTPSANPVMEPSGIEIGISQQQGTSKRTKEEKAKRKEEEKKEKKKRKMQMEHRS